MNDHDTYEALFAAVRDGDVSARPPLLDWLADHPEQARPIGLPTHPELMEGDWDSVFCYASGDTNGVNSGCGTPEPTRPGAPAVSLEPFNEHAVAILLGGKEGERDSEDWLAYGILWDGRAFGVKAGCDYTGFG